MFVAPTNNGYNIGRYMRAESVFRLLEKLNVLPVFLAAMLVAGPGAFPCPAASAERLHANAGVEATTDKPCCAGCARDQEKPARNHRPSGDDAPCDCPPSCPAPCGCGKLPCPPMDLSISAVGLSPIGVLPRLAIHQPADVPAEALFHPPRV